MSGADAAHDPGGGNMRLTGVASAPATEGRKGGREMTTDVGAPGAGLSNKRQEDGSELVSTISEGTKGLHTANAGQSEGQTCELEPTAIAAESTKVAASQAGGGPGPTKPALAEMKEAPAGRSYAAAVTGSFGGAKTNGQRPAKMLRNVWQDEIRAKLQATLQRDWGTPADVAVTDLSPDTRLWRETALLPSDVHRDDALRTRTSTEAMALLAYLRGELDIHHPPNFLKATMSVVQRAVIEQFHATHVDAAITADIPAGVKLWRNMPHLALMEQLYIANTDASHGDQMMGRLMQDVKQLSFDGLHTLKFVFYSRRVAISYVGVTLRLQKATIELEDSERQPGRTSIGTYNPAQLKRLYSLRVLGAIDLGIVAVTIAFTQLAGVPVLDVEYPRTEDADIVDNRYLTLRFDQETCPPDLAGVTHVDLNGTAVRLHHHLTNARVPCYRCYSARHTSGQCRTKPDQLEAYRSRVQRVFKGKVAKFQVGTAMSYSHTDLESLEGFMATLTSELEEQVAYEPGKGTEPALIALPDKREAPTQTPPADHTPTNSAAADVYTETAASVAGKTAVKDKEDGYTTVTTRAARKQATKEKKPKLAGAGANTNQQSGQPQHGARRSGGNANVTTQPQTGWRQQVAQQSPSKHQAKKTTGLGGKRRGHTTFAAFQRKRVNGQFSFLLDTDDSDQSEDDDGYNREEAPYAYNCAEQEVDSNSSNGQDHLMEQLTASKSRAGGPKSDTGLGEWNTPEDLQTTAADGAANVVTAAATAAEAQRHAQIAHEHVHQHHSDRVKHQVKQNAAPMETQWQCAAETVQQEERARQAAHLLTIAKAAESARSTEDVQKEGHLRRQKESEDDARKEQLLLRELLQTHASVSQQEMLSRETLTNGIQRYGKNDVNGKAGADELQDPFGGKEIPRDGHTDSIRSTAPSQTTLSERSIMSGLQGSLRSTHGSMGETSGGHGRCSTENDAYVPSSPDSDAEFTMGPAKQPSNSPNQTLHWLSLFSGAEVTVAADGQCAMMAFYATVMNTHRVLHNTTAVVSAANIVKKAIYALMITNLPEDVQLGLVDPKQELRRLQPAQSIPDSPAAALAALCAHMVQERQRSVNAMVPFSFWAGPHFLRATAQYYRRPLVVIDTNAAGEGHLQVYTYRDYALPAGEGEEPNTHESGICTAITDIDADKYLHICGRLHVLPTFLVLKHAERHFYGVGHGDTYFRWHAEGDPGYVADLMEQYDWATSVAQCSPGVTVEGVGAELAVKVSGENLDLLQDNEQTNNILYKCLTMRQRMDVAHRRMNWTVLDATEYDEDVIRDLMDGAETEIQEKAGMDGFACGLQSSDLEDAGGTVVPTRHSTKARECVERAVLAEILQTTNLDTLNIAGTVKLKTMRDENQQAFADWCFRYRAVFGTPKAHPTIQSMTTLRPWLMEKHKALRHLFAYLPYPELSAKEFPVAQLAYWGRRESYLEQVAAINRLRCAATSGPELRAFCEEWHTACTTPTQELNYKIAANVDRWKRLTQWVAASYGRCQPPTVTDEDWQLMHILPYVVGGWATTPMGRAPSGARAQWHTDYAGLSELCVAIRTEGDWSGAIHVAAGATWEERERAAALDPSRPRQY